MIYVRSHGELSNDVYLVKLTYCQSKDSVKRPRPSLLVAPPKMFVKVAALDPVACIAAKQGIETEFSQGKMYAGKNS